MFPTHSFCVCQDGYVPYHSARIEMCPASTGDLSKRGQVFLEMLNHCLDQLRARPSDHRVFMRCDVNFDATLQGKNLDSIIGRAAHIEFLESDIFVKFIMWSFPDLFSWSPNTHMGSSIHCWFPSPKALFSKGVQRHFRTFAPPFTPQRRYESHSDQS